MTMKIKTLRCMDCNSLFTATDLDCQTMCVECADTFEAEMVVENDCYCAVMNSKEDDTYYCYTEEL